MKRTFRPWMIILTSLAVGVVYWIAEAVYEYVSFRENLRFQIFSEPLSLWDSLILNVPNHSLLIRLSFLAAALLGGLLLAVQVRRYMVSELARQSTENRYQTYFDNAPDGVLVVRLDHRCLQANPAASQIMGYSREEICQRYTIDMVAPEDQDRLPQIVDMLLGAGHYSGELRAVRKDGRKILVSVDAVPLDDEEILIFFQDITVARQTEDELRQAQKMESIGRLAGGLAHDFNNQLTAIMGNAQLLRMELGSEGENGELIEQVCQSCNRAAELTRKLLDFSRRETFQSIPVDLHAAVEEAHSLAESSMSPNIELHVDRTANQPMVIGDPTQIQNAVLNLLLNARDAMADRGNGQIRVRTDNLLVGEEFCRNHPDQIEPGEYVRLTVADTGEGMTPEVQERIFEPFFTTKGKGKGTGLGLSSVYGMVRAHRGFLQVRSQPEKGTVFTLALPVSAESVEMVSDEAVTAMSGQGCILFVDDEEVIRRIAVRALQGLGYTVETCEDGQDAVAAFCAQPDRFDMVVLDLIMPRMGGIQAMEKIRAVAPQVPVVLISGYSNLRRGEELRAAGAQAFLPKPFSIEEFSRVIATNLAVRQK